MGERRGNGWSVKRSENTQYLSSSWSYMGEVHGAPNNYNNSIKDHLSQIIITNIIKMKRFKILHIDMDVDIWKRKLPRKRRPVV